MSIGSSSMTGGGIIVGVRDSLGITGSVGGSRTINGIKEMTFRNAVK